MSRISARWNRMSGPNAHREYNLRVGVGLLHVLSCTMACGGGQVLESDADAASDAPDRSGPPIADIAEPGWREGSDPWVPPAERNCEFEGALQISYDLWAGPDVLYALFAGFLADGGVGVEVRRNDGSGWAPYHRGPCSDVGACDGRCPARLAGFVDDSLLGWGAVPTASSGAGPLWRIGPERRNCWPEALPEVRTAFAVRADLAYAVWPGGSDTGKIIRWDGVQWGPLGVVVPYSELLLELWSDGERLVAVGERGTVVAIVDERAEVLEPPTLATIAAVWSTSDDLLWVGSLDGELFRFDGSSWTPQDWTATTGTTEPCDQPDRIHRIVGMSGSGDVLFFHTEDMIVRRDDSGFRVLGHWPWPARDAPECAAGLRVRAIRATSEDDLFSLLTRENGLACDDAFIVHWDGVAFHWI